MFRVFNKLRRDLIKEKHLIRYLGYAFGEIVLIVVGILIALQINEWAEHRQDRGFEQKTLAQILLNLQTDHKKLTEIRKAALQAVASIDKVLAISDPQNSDDLEYWLADVMQFERFNAISNSYDVLKSRGLDIVQNDELRLTLGIYYDGWAFEIKEHIGDVERAFHDHWVPFIISDIDVFEWDTVARPYDAGALLGNTRFINTLKIQQSNHYGAAEQVQAMLDVNERLQALIQEQLHD